MFALIPLLHVLKVKRFSFFFSSSAHFFFLFFPCSSYLLLTSSTFMLVDCLLGWLPHVLCMFLSLLSSSLLLVSFCYALMTDTLYPLPSYSHPFHLLG